MSNYREIHQALQVSGLTIRLLPREERAPGLIWIAEWAVTPTATAMTVQRTWAHALEGVLKVAAAMVGELERKVAETRRGEGE